MPNSIRVWYWFINAVTIGYIGKYLTFKIDLRDKTLKSQYSLVGIKTKSRVFRVSK